MNDITVDKCYESSAEQNGRPLGAVLTRTVIKVMKVSHFHIASKLVGSQSLLNGIAISSGQLPVLKGKRREALLTIAHSTSL